MHITDPIADMLTRIRNANNAKHDTVDVPASNMKKAIAQILLEESLAGLTLSQDEEDCVYRTVQEGITNAIRHGHATRVQVRCHIEGGVLEVSVRDNGIGCKSVTPGFGLQHMQERMLMLGGTFWYENSDGFCIRAEIPLRKTPGSEKRKQEETV